MGGLVKGSHMLFETGFILVSTHKMLRLLIPTPHVALHCIGNTETKYSKQPFYATWTESQAVLSKANNTKKHMVCINNSVSHL